MPGQPSGLPGQWTTDTKKYAASGSRKALSNSPLRPSPLHGCIWRKSEGFFDAHSFRFHVGRRIQGKTAHCIYNNASGLFWLGGCHKIFSFFRYPKRVILKSGTAISYLCNINRLRQISLSDPGVNFTDAPIRGTL